MIRPHPETDGRTAEEILAAIAETEDKLKLAREIPDKGAIAWFETELALLEAALARRKGKGKKSQAFVLTILKDLFAEKEKPTEWVIDGLLPRSGFAICGGKPKVGKSTLARNAARAVATGEPFLGRNTNAGPVIYLALEEKRSEVKKHFIDMGCTGNEAIYVYASAAPADALTELRAIAEEMQPALIIIDPLFRLAKFRDGNDYAHMTQALDPILRIARDSGTHVLCVHHLGKGDRAGGDAILGSTAIFGTVDTALLMKRTERYRTVETVQRYGTDLEETVLHFDDGTRIISLGESRANEEQNRLGESIEDFLRRRKSGATEAIVDKEVEGRRSVRKRSLRRLVETGRVERSGNGTKNDPYLYRIRFSGSHGYTGNQGTTIQKDGISTENSCQDSGSQDFGQGDSSSRLKTDPWDEVDHDLFR